MSSDNTAVEITISWDDQMHHTFTRQPDGSWNLVLDDPAVHLRLPVTGYDGTNVMRVLSAALETRNIAE